MKKSVLMIALTLTTAGAFAQQYEAKVTISRNVAPGTFREEKALEILAATNTVERTATALYTAGQTVTLQPGFEAKAGSVFQATIGPVVNVKSPELGTDLTAKAYPNPFSAETIIEYSLPKAGKVEFSLFNAQGQLINKTNSQDIEAAGTHRTQVEGTDLPAGIYLYQVQSGDRNKTLRLIKQ